MLGFPWAGMRLGMTHTSYTNWAPQFTIYVLYQCVRLLHMKYCTRSLCEPHMLSMLSFPDRLVVGDNMLALARSGLSYTHQERARSTSYQDMRCEHAATCPAAMKRCRIHDSLSSLTERYINQRMTLLARLKVSPEK